MEILYDLFGYYLKGAEELGLPLEEHISNVIAFMREQADALGL